jgi:uncharacterized protein (DUF58 family)
LKLDRTTVVVNAPRRVTIGDEVTFSVTCRREGGADMAVRVRGPFLPWDGTWTGPPPEELLLQGGESATTTMRARFIARVMHHLDPFTAAAVAPLGLACGPRKESDGAKVWVVPRVADVVRLPLAIAAKHQPGGVALASKAGESMDLVGVRPYRRGDPVRDLHARTWARTGAPATREYQQEYFTRVGVIVDLGFRDAERLESAVELAAGVVLRLSRGDALIDVLVVGDVIHELTVGRSLGRLDQALELLSTVEQGPPLRAASLVKRLEPHLAQLSTVFAIVSPEAAEKRNLEKRLRDHGLACTTVVVDDELARVVFLPPLAQRVQATILAMLNVDSFQATAFSTQMTLGAMTAMLQSDAIVARIEGAHPDYLRGAVYDDYDGAHWTTTKPGRATKVVHANVAATPRATMTLDRHAPKGDDMRWFLPQGACRFDPDIEVDGFGVGRRARGDAPQQLSFAPSGCTPAPVLPPSDTDRNGMRTALYRSLTPIAASWTAGATTDGEKLRAIEEHLSHYEYSLTVERSPSLDPILDFLTVHKAGHCEFFASAMVLLARTQGISARLIGGYRLDEINPMTNQSVVRDRNAHAWVEAWVDGGWHAYDPTPVLDSAGGFFAHASDLSEMLKDRLAAFGPLGFAVVFAGVLAAMFGLRALRTGVHAPRQRRARLAMERPLPCFVELSAKLTAAGSAAQEAPTCSLPSTLASGLGFAPARAPGWSLERVGKVLRLVRHLSVEELHDADGRDRAPIVEDHVLGDPQIAGAERSPDLEATPCRVVPA